MQIQTTRFGSVTINEKDLISIPEGILGFNDLKKFVILEDPDDLIFAWLQSCDKAHVAFPILEPEMYMSDYKARLNKSDREALGLSEGQESRAFTIVTIPTDATLMTANLKAPIIVNSQKRIAKQVVTQENDHPIKHPIFAELQQRVSKVMANAPSTSPSVSVKINKGKPAEALI